MYFIKSILEKRKHSYKATSAVSLWKENKHDKMLGIIYYYYIIIISGYICSIFSELSKSSIKIQTSVLYILSFIKFS